MIDFFRSWVINIVFMIVFIVFIEIIIPSEKFKKYIKLVTGLVLIIVIINPIVTLVSKENSLDALIIKSSNTFNSKQIAVQSEKLDSLQNAQIISIYKEKLVQEIKEQILTIKDLKDATVKVDIETDTNSTAFGTILGIEAEVCLKDKAQSKRVEAVKKVDVRLGNISNEEDELVNKIKNKLSSIYEVSNGKVNIKVQKD